MAEDEWVTGRVGLTIGGYPLDLQMTVPAKPVKPHRMLPIFHQMTNSFADVGVQAEESEGRSISCKAGCGACCRQPVPIAEIEAYQIAELVEAMPEERQAKVKKRFSDAMDHFRTNGWFTKFKKEYDRGSAKTSHEEMKKAMSVVTDYFFEGIPCPFLEDESCSIHKDRPIACREYLVTSPASNCAKPSAEGVKVVALPIRPSKSVLKIASTGISKTEGMLLLIMSLELAEKYPERFPEKTGEQWMADFFGRDMDNTAEKEQSGAAAILATRKRRKPEN
ncbi:MAG: YkgJ family cysteine cluster protein [Pyrinomonadaceae bacterium]